MRASRQVIVGGLCAAIIAAGYVAAPDSLPTLELVVPGAEGNAAASDTPASAGSTANNTAETPTQ